MVPGQSKHNMTRTPDIFDIILERIQKAVIKHQTRRLWHFCLSHVSHYYNHKGAYNVAGIDLVFFLSMH